MTMVTDTSNLSLEEILHYSEVGLLDIEGADLIAQAFREGENKGFSDGHMKGRDYERLFIKDESEKWDE